MTGFLSDYVKNCLQKVEINLLKNIEILTNSAKIKPSQRRNMLDNINRVARGDPSNPKKKNWKLHMSGCQTEGSLP